MTAIATTPPVHLAGRKPPMLKGKRKDAPSRVLIYGPPGVGKTHFAAASGAHFLDLEDGSSEFDVQRLGALSSEEYTRPRTLDEVVEVVDWLLWAEHDVRAVAFDTVDRLEALIHQKICDDGGKPNLEAFGYGKGYNIAVDELRRFLARLDEVRERRGVALIFIGHAKIKKFANPEGEDYDRYLLKVHEQFAGVLCEWCDVVGFAQHEVAVAKLKGSERDDRAKPKAKGTGYRELRLERDAAFEAKSRYAMGKAMELSWRKFSSALRAAKARTASTTDALAAPAEDNQPATAQQDTGAQGAQKEQGR